jgi:hypothetical protein
MEVCLPTDFYKLRDELGDWRDAPARDYVKEDTHIRETRDIDARHADSMHACADQDWRVL